MCEKSYIRFTPEDTRVVKGVAIILMFMHHLFAFPERIPEALQYIPLFSWRGQSIELLLASFGKICVMLFTFLGGYGVYSSCQGKDPGCLSGILWKRIKLLYKSYWQVFLIFIPVCIIFQAPNVAPTLIDFLKNFSGLYTYYNPEWWFFTSYSLLLLFFPVIYSISNRFVNVFSEFLMILAVNTFEVYIAPSITLTIPWASSLMDSLVYYYFLEMLELLPGFWMGCLFAKYNLLSFLKTSFSEKTLCCFLGILSCLVCVYIRRMLGFRWDFVITPFFCCSVIAALNCKPGLLLRKVLISLGEESTFCWLIHSFYCYYLCQKLIYAPRYSILILSWLLLLTYATAKGIRFFFQKATALSRYLSKQHCHQP